MKTKKLISLAITILFAAVLAHSQEPRNHPKPEELIVKFADEEFPKGFKSKTKLASLLQMAVNKIYPTGFRYLGDKQDFFHGHILYVLDSNGVPQSVAILYHTQEEAYEWHKQFPHGTYDYLDRQTRNWIQWLDRPEIVENANKYERGTYPTGSNTEEQKKWQMFVDKSLPVQKIHCTIKEWMLDPKFFGGEIAFSVTWRFYEVEKIPKDPDLNVVAITLPKEKKPIFLALKTTRARSNGVLIRKSYDSLLYKPTQFDKYLY